MIGPGFVLRMAWREGRAGRRKLGLLTGAVAAGVAALVAINSFTLNLTDSVEAQARAMLGADIIISSRQPFPDRASALVDSLQVENRVARMVSFAGMAYVPRTSGVRLVQVRAVEPAYPFYGEIITQPAGLWPRLSEGGIVLVDPTLLPALDARVGDTLALGETTFTIGGVVTNFPGSVGIASAFGPRVFIGTADLAATGLLEFGARVEYATYAQLADPSQGPGLRTAYREELRTHRVAISTVENESEELSEALERLGRYLGLVALVALLLGGLGVASAVHVFIRQKLDTIAVLRCLGATTPEIFVIYLLQAVAMGGLGSLLGAAIGLGVQQGLPLVFSGLLPLDVQVLPAPRAILMGIGLGLWVSGIFALLPLLGVRRVSPLMTLRRDYEPPRRRWDPILIMAGLLLLVSIVLLAAVQVRNLREGAIFTGGALAVLVILWLAALGLIRGVRRWFPSRWPYLVRQGLANLYRPANQTVTVVLSLGFGAFLLSTLYLVQHNLLRQFRLDGAGGTRPNLMFFEIQPDQGEGVAQIMADAGHPGAAPVPIVPMRIRSIKGELVGAYAASTMGAAMPPDPDSALVGAELAPPAGPDSHSVGAGPAPPAEPDSLAETSDGGGQDGRPRGWGVRREYRSTYRDTLTGAETLVAGRSWEGEPRAPGDPVPVSIEVSISEELGVTIGDEIEWDVLGTVVRSRVWSVREVDWGRFETNFFVVFATGALERAPQMLVTLTRVEDATARGALQRTMAERYPNVTAIDLSQVQQAIENVLDKATLVVRFMALFSLATGAIVLIGAVATSRYQRIREGVLLKTLGATRAQVLRVMITEYLALGLMAATASVV
ncbi:MAG TPA: FtsX-like permease family protein, partial [Gemmatimonadales bacterium]|nr:FtsX-like permease family protein [Gemmatimonadales bacterium]